MMPSEYDIAGKVIFITGAGRGIGKGIAQVLAEAGADIALNALTPKYLESTAAEIAAATGRRVVPIVADVTKPDQRPARRRSGSRHVRPHRCPGERARRFDPQAARYPAGQPRQWAQRSRDPSNGQRPRRIRRRASLHHRHQPHRGIALHPRRRSTHAARRSGKVINIASWTAHQGGRDMVLYTAAKSGLAGFTRAQALEWAPYGVHVNAISPGFSPTS